MTILVNDVLIEILIGLPVKSLVRFSCVSKDWYALIRSSYFIIRHLKRECKCKRVLFNSKPEQGKGYVLSFHDIDSSDWLVSPSFSFPVVDNSINRRWFDYCGTSNGLVCLALSENYIFNRQGRSRPIAYTVILCNPALQELRVLDPTPFPSQEDLVAFVIGWGFGFDANTNSYKIVRLWENINKERFYDGYEYRHTNSPKKIDLYDSSTNSWRPIEKVVPIKVTSDRNFNLFFNGCCHWNTTSNCILSFNLSTEAFQLLGYPNFEDIKYSSLLVFNQCLSIVRYVGWMDDRAHAMDIWVMKEYGVKESWTKILVIRPYILRRPLLFLDNDWLLIETRDGQLASCALHHYKIKRSPFQWIGTGTRKYSMRAVTLTESLISLK